MPIITLTTDFGLRDNYVALVKAEIYKRSPSAIIIDITHDIDKFNLSQAAYIFGNAYLRFPVGSIHILGVGALIKNHEACLIIRNANQTILCPDNGIFPLMHSEVQAEYYKVRENLYPIHSGYVKDVLAPCAAEINRGVAPGEIGNRVDEIYSRLNFHPTGNAFSITGRCVYIDSFGNVITNISKEFFERSRKGRKFTIHLPAAVRITEISSDYSNVPENSALALFNDAGFLEIAINTQKASQLLFPRSSNQHTEFNINIEFDE